MKDDEYDSRVKVLSSRRVRPEQADPASVRRAEIAEIGKSLAEQMAKIMEDRPERCSPPTEWELTVTARDGDRRIKKMTIKAVD